MMPGEGQGNRFTYDKVSPPTGIADVPRYLKELLGGFFSRMSYIFKIVWRTSPWILAAMMLITALQGILPVVGAKISQHVLNEMQEVNGSFEGNLVAFLREPVFFLLVFFFVYNIVNSLVTTFRNTVVRISGELMVRTVKLDIMEKSRTLDICAFDLPAFYEKLENANREAGTRPVQVLSATFTVISTMISIVSYAIILIVDAHMWWMLLLLLVVSIPTAVISFHFRQKNFRYIRLRSRDRRQMNYYSEVMVNKDLAKEVRMYGLADTFIQRYAQTFDNYYRGIRQLIWRENTWHMISTVFSAVVNCAFFGWFAYAVVTGKDHIGDYSLYTGALTSIAGLITTLISVSSTIFEGTLFIDNLISFLKEEPTVVPLLDPADDRERPRSVNRGQAHTIVFDHVSFIYPGTTRKVLDDINLTIRPGETLVLVGLNGAGKTTLLKLLTRLYDPTEGRIFLDGYDIREYDVTELYQMFGIIFQDFGKYAVTVTENIQFGDIYRTLDNEAIVQAAVEAGAKDYIDRLPDGFGTPLMRIFSERGIELSIGQWQKLAIARAFYSESDVLILDEPTASLDPMAEQEIFNQFDRLRQDKTTIFVSHRLSSATVASKIAVLEYGKLIEEGDHKTLMALEGRYYELFTTQAKRYVEERDGASNEEKPSAI